jgi:hypothetical protein
MKNKFLIALASSVIILSIMACSLGKVVSTPTSQPPVNPTVNSPVNPPVNPPTDALEILSTSTFTDSYGGFYVFGEVTNNSDTPITSIELIVEIKDANNTSLLKDDNGNITPNMTFYPMLYTIAAGESSPFSYYFDTTNGIPANYKITIGTYQATEANRGELQSENVQIVDDGSGSYYLSGELVNLSDQWVHINGLAGGVLDDANTVLSADWTGTYTTELAPAGNSASRDRTPFVVSISVPTGDVTQWSLWWDADIATDVTDYSLQVEVTNSYFDEYGSVHIVGLVTNNADQALSSLVVAGLFAQDGICLDADYTFLPYAIQPGMSVPFDASYFGNVNYSDAQAALLDSYTVQVDPWNTYPPYYTSVNLTSSGETVQKDGSYWTVDGNFTNTSDKNLSGVTVVVSVYDSQNTLVATGYTYVYPDGDSYIAGSGDTYEVSLYLDPAADTTGYTTQIVVVADVSE